MKKTYLSLLFFIAFFFSFISCSTVSQLAAFVNCKYDFNGLSNPSIAGIGLSGLQDVNNLNANSLLKLTTSIMSGNLPLSATVNVKATNPNSTMAQIAGLEWAIDMNSSNILTGYVNQKVSVPANGGQTTIPFTFQIDIMQVLKGESKDNIFKFVNHILHAGESSSNISIRVKPTVTVGGRNVSTGYITLKKTV